MKTINEIVLEESRSLLDSNSNKSRHGVWDKKQRRAYMRLISGVKRAVALGKFTFHLTLTSSLCAGDLSRSWDLLVKRVRRELRFNFQYFKVETSEGNGVLHCVVVCDDFRVLNWEYDSIHAYFSCLWKELHASPIVYVSVFRSNINKFCGYIISQYVCGHSFLRSSMSFLRSLS